MNIGSIAPSSGGELIGHIAIMNFDARIAFKPVASANERAPKFEVMAQNVARRWVRIGALWEKEARGTGEVYLTGHIDDPALPDKLYVAAFRQADGGYAVAWSRTGVVRSTEATADASDGAPPFEGEPADGSRPPVRASANDDPFG